jgi:hypothetical protein
MRSNLNVNWFEVERALEMASHGQKSGILFNLKEQYGLSRDQVYRELRKLRGPKKTVKRERSISRETAMLFAEAKVRGYQAADAERNVPTHKLLDWFIRTGVIQETEAPSVSAINRILREEFGFNEKQARVLWKCDFALQDVQLDFSNSKHFRIVGFDAKKQDWLLKASPRPLSYRLNPNKEKVILAGIHDKYSGLNLIQGYAGCAESFPILINHMNFWLLRGADEHLMHHLGYELAHDNGSVFKTPEWLSIREALGYTERNSRPYKKTGIGSVERKWKALWADEVIWSFEYEHIFLSEYNEILHEAMIREHNSKHAWMEGTKGAIYQQSILKTRPKSVDVNLIDIAFRSWERTVDDALRVQVDGEFYRVPQYTNDGTPLINKRVRVSRNVRGELIGETIENWSQPFTLELYERRSKSDYSGSVKENFRERMEKQLKTGSWVHAEIIQKNEKEAVRRLLPARNVAEVTSKFTPSVVEVERFDSILQAKIWVGKELELVGVSYSSVADFFDYEIALNLEKEHLNKVLQEFKQLYTAKTGS